MEQILLGCADTAKSLEPEFGVLFFVVGGLQEESGNLLIACLLGDGCEIGVFVPGLGLTGEGLPEVLLGLGTGIGVGAGGYFDFLEDVGLLTFGAGFGGYIANIDVAANLTYEFFHCVPPYTRYFTGSFNLLLYKILVGDSALCPFL